jgi:hypothetical protein
MSIIKPNVHVIFSQLGILSPCHFQSMSVLNIREFLSPEGGHMALHGNGAELLLSPEVERCVKEVSLFNCLRNSFHVGYAYL